MKYLVYLMMFLLAIIGTAFIFSATNETSLIVKQTVFFFMASLVYWALQYRPGLERRLAKKSDQILALGALLGSVLLLLAVLVLGREIKGARRWLHFGPVALQATEFVKVFALVFFAFLLEKTRTKYAERDWPELPALVVFGILAVLILNQPDYGSLVLLTLVVGGMMFLSGLPWKRIVLYIVVLGALATATVGAAGYRMKRLEAFKDPWAHRYESGFQTLASYEALGTGHILGVGFQQGTQKKHLPEAQNDYILSVIGEETGLVGVSVVLLLYSLLVFSALKLVRTRLHGWHQLYGMGVVLITAGSVCMNLYVVTGMVPSKGIALPMISSGGSSLLSFVLMYGLLVRFSDHAYEVDHA